VRLKWKLILVSFEIVQFLMQDWYTVWAKRTIGKEIILDEPDATLR
jgi:hypothetical protein